MATQPNKDRPNAYAVPTLTEARAVHAWFKGEASSEQMKIAYNWVVKDACRGGRDVLAPGQPDVTAYWAGRLSVALQIGWVLSQPIDAFRQGETDG